MVRTTGESPTGPTPNLRPKLSELAAQIAQNAKIVEDYIESQGLPYPSFATDGPAKFPLPPPSTPELEKIHAARQEVLAASKSIYDLTSGPNEVMQWLIWGVSSSLRCCATIFLCWVCHRRRMLCDLKCRSEPDCRDSVHEHHSSD